MKQKLTLLLCALLLVCSLAACGGSAGDAGNSGASSETSAAPAERAGDDAGWDMAAEEAVSAGETTVSSRPAQEKIIRAAVMEMESRDFDAAAEALDQAVEALGGYYESRNIYRYSAYRSASFSVRVPAERFDDFLSQAGQAAHVTRQEENALDVSESYYDLEARLATQRTKLERLQTLLAQAATMEDIIQLESAISDTELEIEYLTGSLRQYDSQIQWSTVSIDLQEVYRLSDEEVPAETFGQRLSAAFASGLRRGLENLEDLTVFLAGHWIDLLVLLLIALAVLLFFRRRRAGKPPKDTPRRPPEDTGPTDGQ